MANLLQQIKLELRRGLDLDALGKWIGEQFIQKKLNTPLGIATLGFLALALGILIGLKGAMVGLTALVVVISVPLIMASLFNLRFGLSFVLILSFFILGIKRYVEVFSWGRFDQEIPLGLIMDVLVSVMFFGLLLKQIKERDWSFARNIISTMILIWMAYNLIEVANPIAASRMAWLYTIRSMAGVMIMFFISLYVINRIEIVNHLFKLVVGLSVLAALYAIWQEFVGLTAYEDWWVRSDPELFGLLFQAGKIRKFSFLSGPVILGIVMAYSSLMCFILMLGPFDRIKRLGLAFAGVIMLVAMIFTGTRTAYLLLPAGMFFYAMISLRREVVLAGIGVAVLGAIVLSAPTVNADHHRIKTAFSIFTGDKSARDPSFEIRLQNQKQIQPFIQQNPLGGGLGSVGAWGKRFSPGTFLANFPPDSGYMRIAVEQGWLGLLLYCSLLFIIMRTGIKNYFSVRDPLIRTYYQVCLTFLFTLIIANYPQEAITQLPTSFLFYIVIAMLVKLKDFDPQNRIDHV